MKSTTKAALLFFAFLVCALGAVLSPREPVPNPDSKSHVVPVSNRQPHRGVWLQV